MMRVYGPCRVGHRKRLLHLGELEQPPFELLDVSPDRFDREPGGRRIEQELDLQVDIALHHVQLVLWKGEEAPFGCGVFDLDSTDRSNPYLAQNRKSRIDMGDDIEIED